MKLVVNQAYENMGLSATQTLGPILDGLMRNTPDALDSSTRPRARASGGGRAPATPRSATTPRRPRPRARTRPTSSSHERLTPQAPASQARELRMRDASLAKTPRRPMATSPTEEPLMDTRHEEPRNLAEELDLPEQLDDDEAAAPPAAHCASRA